MNRALVNLCIAALLIPAFLFAAGCVDSLQAAAGQGADISGPVNVSVTGAAGQKNPHASVMQVEGGPLPLKGPSRNNTGDSLPLPLPDAGNAHESLIGRSGDMSRTVISGGAEGSTNITGSSAGSSGSPAPSSPAAGTGPDAPMPGSGLGSFSEPGSPGSASPGSGSTTSPPGAYYEGSGTDNTEFRNSMIPDCGCA